jgi:hypothetical protein
MTKEISDYVKHKAAETGITGIDLPDFKSFDEVDKFFKIAASLFATSLFKN